MGPVAFIPARGNSKRLPKKNIALLSGKPLVVYAVDVALQSKIFSQIIVSSEDDDVLRTVSEWRGRVVTVIRRDPLWSTDDTPVAELCGHLLEYHNCEAFAVVLPTSPLRTAEDIKDVWEIYQKEKPDVVMSVSAFSYPPQHGVLIEDGEIRPGPYICTRRQHMPVQYRHDGVILFCNTTSFLEAKGDSAGFYFGRILPYFTPIEHSVDIDTQMDLNYAEFLIWKERRRSVEAGFGGGGTP